MRSSQRNLSHQSPPASSQVVHSFKQIHRTHNKAQSRAKLCFYLRWESTVTSSRAWLTLTLTRQRCVSLTNKLACCCAILRLDYTMPAQRVLLVRHARTAATSNLSLSNLPSYSSAQSAKQTASLPCTCTELSCRTSQTLMSQKICLTSQYSGVWNVGSLDKSHSWKPTVACDFV